MRDDQRRHSVCVRLEGGLGDHLLGMRVLEFVRAQFPAHEITILSDCAGHETQLAIARLSPYVSDVVPVFQKPGIVVPVRAMGKLEYLDERALRLIRRADAFVDTYGEEMLVAAAMRLDRPLFEILGNVPTLLIPLNAIAEAQRLLEQTAGTVFVAMNLGKYGSSFLHNAAPIIDAIIEPLLRHPSVVVLNLLTSAYEFSHWPEPARSQRGRLAREEASYLCNYGQPNRRIVSCVDLPVTTVAALLGRCSYFLGVDNGIKHLAWALGVPHSFIHPSAPDMRQILRWMPDVNRMLGCSCNHQELSRHIDFAVGAVINASDHRVEARLSRLDGTCRSEPLRS